MSLITPKSQLEQDLSDKDAGVIRACEALHHAATVIKAENARFWATPTDRLLTVLNHDIAATTATFKVNTAASTAINTLLDEVGLIHLSNRAPVTPGRNDIVFNGSAFVYVAPPEPEPNPDLFTEP